MVGLYLRVSTEKQADKYSLPEQEKLGLAFAQSIGESYLIYKEAKTGTSMVARLELQRLLDDVQRSIIDKVWVVDQNRLGRETGDAIVIRKIFTKHNTQFYEGGILQDLKSRTGSLAYNLKAVIAEDARAQLLETTQRGITNKINRGERTLPHVLGYNQVYDTQGHSYWKINEEEAKVVRLIFDLFTKGSSQYSIVQYLHNQGYKTKRGKEWYNPNVGHILHRIEYTGFTTDKENNIIKSTVYEPIIPFDQWKEINDNWQTISRPRPLRNAKYLATAIVRCKECGKFYKYQKNLSDKKRCYPQYEARHLPTCTNKGNFKAILIETIVERCYFKMMSEPEKVQMLLNERRKAFEVQNAANNERREQYSKRLETLSKQQKNIIDAVADAVLSNDEAKPKMDGIREERLKLEAELKTIKNELEESEMTWAQTVLYAVQTAKDYVKEKDVGKKRKYLKNLIKEATIDKGHFHIEFKNGWTNDLDLKNLPPEYGNELVTENESLYDAIRDKRFKTNLAKDL
jgi:site-specific DNA recombinase